MCAGVHGAGLTNMIWMPANSSVLEIPLKYFPSRLFGFMAVGLGIDYWTVPSVQFGYVAKHTLIGSEVEAIVRAVRHIVRVRGLSHLLAMRSDDGAGVAEALYPEYISRGHLYVCEVTIASLLLLLIFLSFAKRQSPR